MASRTDTPVTPASMETVTDLTADDVIAKIDELVNVAQFLKRVAKPMVRRYSRKRAKNTDAGSRRNGFAVPVHMNLRLVNFMNEQTGSTYTPSATVARTEVTSTMTKYIKENNLQTPENRKNFTMDEALANVFEVEPGTVSNWFEMQKYLTKVVTSANKTNENETDAPTNTPTNAVDDGDANATAMAVGNTMADTSKGQKAGKRIKRS